MNQGPSVIELAFCSTQRYDFLILQGKVVVWQWSAELMFAMVMESVVLKAGEELVFNGEWLSEGAALDVYTLVGRIVSKPVYEAKCIFKISR
jgi:hypothetical protein